MHPDETQPRVGLWFMIIVVLAVLAVAVLYFGDKNSAFQTALNNPTPHISTRPERLYSVDYLASVFSPTNLRIHVGDSVRFLNKSTGPIYIVADDSDGATALTGFSSLANIPPDGIFAFTFTKVGIFGYRNDLSSGSSPEHGTIIVRP